MERVAIESTCVASVGYSAEGRILEVEFLRGQVYRYLDVPPGEHTALVTADSVGVYLNRVIKPRFDCVRVDGGGQ